MRSILRHGLRLLGYSLSGLVYLWCIGALWYLRLSPEWLGPGLGIAFALLLPTVWFVRRRMRRGAAVAFGVVFALLVGITWAKQPSETRAWTQDMAVSPVIDIETDVVRIANVRDCSYRTTDDYDVHLLEQVFDLGTLQSVDLLVERFHPRDFLAHTLLSFAFSDGRHLAISVELRREIGEEFDPIAGIYQQYELMYVLGTERDLIGLRTNVRKSRTWLYPMRATPEHVRALFLAMLRRARNLQSGPEFYNTLTNSCTTNIVDHVRTLVPGRIPLDARVLLPGYAGEMAHELGLIDSDLPLDEAMAAFRIDERAQTGPLDEDFSRRIRSGRPARAP